MKMRFLMLCVLATGILAVSWCTGCSADGGKAVLPEGWSSISSGSGHTLAIGTDGSLWGWGRNTFGQLGNGTGGNGWDDRSGDQLYPVQIGTDHDWVLVAASDSYTVAAKSDGSLWKWGLTEWGRAVSSKVTKTSILSPVRVTQ